jgi:hypothetical protein
MANTNSPHASPTQNPFPAWYLRDGAINAADDFVEKAASSCERWEWGCAFVVVLSVAAEFVLASIHPSYDSPWNRWGTAIADALIALGIVGEVLFGRIDGRYQTELRKRSNDRLAQVEFDNGYLQDSAAQAMERASLAEKAAAEANLKLAPRSMWSPMRAAVRETIRHFAGNTVDIISYCGTLPESTRVCGILSETFHKAGWKPRTWSAVGSSLSFEGIFVAIKGDTLLEIRQAGAAVFFALGRTEWAVQEHLSPVNWEEPAPWLTPDGWDHKNPAPIRIIVGFKP